jgi:hypothetical protein
LRSRSAAIRVTQRQTLAIQSMSSECDVIVVTDRTPIGAFPHFDCTLNTKKIMALAALVNGDTVEGAFPSASWTFVECCHSPT